MKPMLRIHNTEIDEIIDREMTDEEYEQYLLESEIIKEQELKIKQKQEARQSALAKLAALGLTEEEIAAL